MKKYPQLVQIMILAAFLSGGCAEQSPRHIGVTASAEIAVAPETATFYFSITDRGQSLPSLKGAVDKKAGQVVKLCKKLGISEEDIVASEVVISPQYDWDNNKFLAYEVSRDVEAKLRDLNQYSNLLNGAIEAGITNIQSIEMDVDRRKDLERQALEMAIENARDKAEVMARKAKVRLGNILTLEEVGGYVEFNVAQKYVPGLSHEAAADVFEPGKISISNSVKMTITIK